LLLNRKKKPSNEEKSVLFGAVTNNNKTYSWLGNIIDKEEELVITLRHLPC
jgi:hypothetical protein